MEPVPSTPQPSAPRWQCQVCKSCNVKDEQLSLVQQTEVHRLICQDCGVVRHYDRLVGQDAPEASLHKTFRRLDPGQELKE